VQFPLCSVGDQGGHAAFLWSDLQKLFSEIEQIVLQAIYVVDVAANLINPVTQFPIPYD
jgi:hypothetical protein